MDKNNIAKNIILSLFVVFSLGGVFAQDLNSTTNIDNVSIALYSDKNIYSVGENVNLTLQITNLNSEIVNGQIKGKVIIGDIGYEIQCFDYNAPANNSAYLGLTPLPASLSNSNTKTMTTLYACSGTQMQSSKTMIDNSNITNQNGQEVFELGPFTYSYTYNNSDYEVKSNTLNITVTSQSNQQSSQNSQSSQSSNTENSQTNSQSSTNQNQQNTNTNSNTNSDSNSNPNTANSQTSQNHSSSQNQGLSSQNTQSLTNNQQNAQSVNQLKNDINQAKSNPLDLNTQTKEKSFFWITLLVLIVVIIASILVYNKLKKRNSKFQENENLKIEVVNKPKIPKYINLLKNLEKTSNTKEKAKILSQIVRDYIRVQNNIKEELTHSKAKKLTNDKTLIEILDKTEMQEFANKTVHIDYKIYEKKLRGIFENE